MIYMAVELRCYLTPTGKIHISGGKCGNYDKSLSGKRIPEGSILMEVEEIVLDFSDFTDYHTPDMNFLQWEEWSEIIKFAPISEVRDYIIAPMIKNNTSHDKWVNLMEKITSFREHRIFSARFGEFSVDSRLFSV